MPDQLRDLSTLKAKVLGDQGLVFDEDWKSSGADVSNCSTNIQVAMGGLDALSAALSQYSDGLI